MFNWGALLGSVAVLDSIYLPLVLPLHAGGIAWTLVYDTLYAHQVSYELTLRLYASVTDISVRQA